MCWPRVTIATPEREEYGVRRHGLRRCCWHEVTLDVFLRFKLGAIGVIRDIDVERGVHLLSRVIRRRVFYHRNLVAKLSGKANSRLDARMRYEPDDDELMNTMLLELQIQICVGEATRTPMLCGDYLA